jgi:integrase
MASLYQRNNGTYYASFYDSSKSPPQRRASLRTSRKKIARRHLTDLERAYEEGQFSPWLDGKAGDPFRYDDPDPPSLTPIPLSALVERFCRMKEKQGRAARTIERYRGVWTRFLKTVDADTLTTELQAPAIHAFCYRTDLAQSTRCIRFALLNSALRWAADNDYLESNPADEVDPPKQENTLPTPVRPEELEKIIKAIGDIYREKRPRGNCNPREIIWTIPIFRFAMYSGLRASELANLRWRDLDLERKTIFIGAEQKSKKENFVPLIKPAREVLRYVGSERKPEHFVFKTPNGHPSERNARYFAQLMSTWFCKARRKAELSREVTFHDLRGGFASRLAEQGASAHVIRKALRHAGLEMALKYIDVAQNAVRDEMEEAFS